MVIVFRSSQFSRPAAKGGIIFIYICLLFELILTILEIVFIIKMWIDTYEPRHLDYTHGFINTIFILSLFEHLLFLFLYSWQIHLAKYCLKACNSHRREYEILNRYKGKKISLDRVNICLLYTSPSPRD